MASEAREIIQRFAKQGYAPRMKGVKGSYRFDIGGLGSYRVGIDDGKLDIRESQDAADCVIACDEADFVRIMRGEQNLITAMMQGRVGIVGDLSLALKFHGVLPAPPSKRGAEAARRAP